MTVVLTCSGACPHLRCAPLWLPSYLSVIIFSTTTVTTTTRRCCLVRRAENEALRQTLLACQEKLRSTEERAKKAEDQIEAESAAREAVEKTLVSLERVREQGENVVKVEMNMRKDLGRDLVTAMETVAQLEKQLNAANGRLKEERLARKKAASRLQQSEADLEKCRHDVSALKGELAMTEHASQLRTIMEQDLHTALQEVTSLRAQLTESVEQRAQVQGQLNQMQQELEAMQRYTQAQLMQAGNEARLKEHLQVRGAEDFQAFRAQANAEAAHLREKMKRSKLAAVQSETALQEALAELRAKERDVANLSWRVDRISDLLTAQQRMQNHQPASMPQQVPNFSGGGGGGGGLLGGAYHGGLMNMGAAQGFGGALNGVAPIPQPQSFGGD